MCVHAEHIDAKFLKEEIVSSYSLLYLLGCCLTFFSSEFSIFSQECIMMSENKSGVLGTQQVFIESVLYSAPC